MTHYLLLFVCIWWHIGHNAAYAFSTPTGTSSAQGGISRRFSTTLYWSDGKNAAPAIMCEVENIPLLDPVPNGFKRLFLVRHGEVINPVSYGTLNHFHYFYPKNHLIDDTIHTQYHHLKHHSY